MKLNLLLLFLTIHTSFAMQIFAKLSNGKTIALEVEPIESIEGVRAMIRNQNGLAPECQTLMYAGKVLEDYRTLGDYNINKEATIYVTEPLMQVKTPLVDTIFTSAGQYQWNLSDSLFTFTPRVLTILNQDSPDLPSWVIYHDSTKTLAINATTSDSVHLIIQAENYCYAGQFVADTMSIAIQLPTAISPFHHARVKSSTSTTAIVDIKGRYLSSSFTRQRFFGKLVH